MQSVAASSIATSSSSAEHISSARAPIPTPGEDRRARLQSFGLAIDAIRDRAEAVVGAEDVAHVTRIDRFSRAMEVVGRVLIHVSPEPLSFTAGVLALWLHKQLQATEVGHTALHGAYDKLPGAEKFNSKTFAWDVPIDEESWKVGHNVKHHQYTNVAGKDPDIHFGPARLTEHTPHKPFHRFQHLFMVGVLAPNFTFLMNWHFTGLNDAYFGNGRGGLDVLRDRSSESVKEAHRRAFRKYAPYYLKNYVFFPALAGPMFWKVLLGNWMAETLRDLYSAATIYCGHVGEDVAAYEEGTKAHGRGEWYAMEIEATNDFEVSLPVSILCGGLDKQIEHHLFPKLPPNRLREVAPQVRAACEAHGISYKTDTWGKTLAKAFKHVKALSFREAIQAAA